MKPARNSLLGINRADPRHIGKATDMDSTSEFRVRSKVCDWSVSGSVEVIWCYEFGLREGTKLKRSHDVGSECGRCRVRGVRLVRLGEFPEMT